MGYFVPIFCAIVRYLNYYCLIELSKMFIAAMGVLINDLY